MTDLKVSQLNNNKIVDYKSSKPFDDSVIYAQDKVHAMPARGKLVSSSIVTAPFRFIKDTAEDTVNLGRAITTGKSDDYKLGRVNDLALKLGSLGIAGYLFTKRPKTSQKYMELIGFGSFFASMALWPKLFIQAPAKLINGIDVFQEYEDSQGRRKRFFQDPQYLPWDIYSPKEMEKLGDRLGIPKNIRNRSDLTKEKAHKIALQSNTMWMLSAGFGVPIMSAFICSGLEKLLPERIAKYKLKKSQAKIDNMVKANFNDIAPSKNNVEVFNNFMSQLKTNEPMNDKTLRELAIAITGDSTYSEALYKEMQNNSLFNSSKKVSDKTIDKMFDKFEDVFESLGIKKETFLEKFAQHKNTPESKQIYFVQKALQETSPRAKRQKFEFVKDFIEHEGLQSAPLSKEAIEKAKELNGIFARFATVQSTFTEDLLLKSASSSEAIGTKHWQDFSKALTKIFNLSDAQMKQLGSTDKTTTKLVNDVLFKAVKDDSSYSKHFNSLLDVVKAFHSDMDLQVTEKYDFFKNGKSCMLDSMTKDKDNLFNVFAKAANALQNAGFADTAQRIVVRDASGNVVKDAISQAGTIVSKTMNLPNNAKFSAFSRSLLTLDFYKRKADGVLGNQIKEIAERKFNNAEELSPKVLKTIEETAEKILLKGELNDFVTKFNTKGDSGLVYRAVMDLLFNPENLSDKTKKLFTTAKGELPEFAKFKLYMDSMKDTIGNLHNPHFRNIFTNSAKDLGEYLGNSNYKIKPGIFQSMIGDNLPSMLRKAYDSITNTKIWTKKFATLGIAVAAITVLSQFFFGRINTPIQKPNSKEAK